MPINCNRVVGRHEAAFDVVVDGCRRALPGIADAGAAWCQHHQPVVGRHLLKAFSTQLLAGLQADIAGLAVLAAIAAARRMIDAVKRGQDVERRIDAAADLDDLAEAAAGAPAPPESGRSSLRQKISGVCVSAISTGVPRTPLG